MNRFAAIAAGITALTIPIAGTLRTIAAQSAADTKTPPNTPFNYNWPDGPGKAIVKKACLACHNAGVIVQPPGRTADKWADEIGKMIGRGAVLSDEDADQLVDYLSAHFGPDFKGAPPAIPGSQEKLDRDSVNVNTASAEELQSALGLSPAEANSIVQHRKEHGAFKNWREVASVQGVLSDKIERNQKRLVF